MSSDEFGKGAKSLREAAAGVRSGTEASIVGQLRSRTPSSFSGKMSSLRAHLELRPQL